MLCSCTKSHYAKDANEPLHFHHPLAPEQARTHCTHLRVCAENTDPFIRSFACQAPGTRFRLGFCAALRVSALGLDSGKLRWGRADPEVGGAAGLEPIGKYLFLSASQYIPGRSRIARGTRRGYESCIIGGFGVEERRRDVISMSSDCAGTATEIHSFTFTAIISCSAEPSERSVLAAPSPS